MNDYGQGFTYTFTQVQFSGGQVTGFQMNFAKRTTLRAAELRLRSVLPADARLVWTVSGAECHTLVFSTAQLASLQTANVTAYFQTLHWQAQNKSFNPRSVQDVVVSTGTAAAGSC